MDWILSKEGRSINNCNCSMLCQKGRISSNSMLTYLTLYKFSECWLVLSFDNDLL